ncbi:MAG: hypothetical protein AUJ75_01715 [Candidatus Omnitrophica bacterium CG1_02_49_10]|nr:MAG: hypothetical protein AUJ75_01715 [Candidatus Omnitrophica bacterium CG1_02_49_10]
MTLESYIKARRSAIDKELKGYIISGSRPKRSIYKAMEYALFPGGKRIRAVLCLAAYEVFRGDIKRALPAACAVELVHNFSLVHDDLPAIDDDDMRRGKPSCHKKFGEAMAILCGDAMMALAFEVIAKDIKGNEMRDVAIELSAAIGASGMVGGQAADIELSKERTDLPHLEYVSIHKTGKLIAASLKIGAIMAKAGKADIMRIFRFGEYLGLVFQIVDDILDRDGYAELFGIKGARAEAVRLCAIAEKEISKFGAGARILNDISLSLLNRTA